MTDIRPATSRDAPAIHTLYAPIVAGTHISFEVEPPSVEELRRRMEAAPIPWLVRESAGGITGFASAGLFRERAAYRWTAEMSIYVAERERLRGVGRALGGALLDRLRVAGYRSAVGVVALPNPASEGLLRALGFRPVGLLREAGFKLDRWWDVQLWQRVLEEPQGDAHGRGRGDRLEDPPPQAEEG
ncbi:MAG TPA: GNAT family N-acetyltransferase [Gemmatimonadota bacterium]|nr:GNAT family N-acetyltransferase [Gemmatimonadota bacterium]